jgi:hypothetical protein
MGSYGVQEDRGSSVRSDPVEQSGYIGFPQTITAYFYLFQQLVYLVVNFWICFVLLELNSICWGFPFYMTSSVLALWWWEGFRFDLFDSTYLPLILAVIFELRRFRFWSFSSYGVTRPRGRVWIRFWSGNLLNEPEKERKEVKDGRSGGILTCEPYLHTYIHIYRIGCSTSPHIPPTKPTW